MRVLSRRARAKLLKQGPIDEGAVTTGIWAKNARFVQKRSWLVATIAIVIMIILILPYFSLRLGSSDAGNDAASTTTRKSYDLLANGFGPGFNGPLQLVGKINTPTEITAFNSLAKKVSHISGVAQVAEVPITSQTKIGIIQVVPATSPESKATSDLILNLRDNIIPNAEKGTSLRVYVGGITAIFNDFSSVISSKLPLFLGVIIGLGFIILMIAFRSFVVPLTASIMNLFAAGAAFGVVVAIFQWGWLSGILHTGGPGPVEAFLPVIMLAILFGLSMDYQVFLVSRMHEEWTHTDDNDRAVRVGQAETGRVITAAASIMILVFLSFIFEGQRVISEFGIGLSAAVLLDAFILRNFLVPAVMHRFGRANWWLPKWLDKILPHLAVEPAEKTEDK
jgi:RND superfamily putative drug exporter